MLCYVAQYLNTSVTPLIASAEIHWLSVLTGGVLFRTGFPDFTPNWRAAPRVPNLGRMISPRSRNGSDLCLDIPLLVRLPFVWQCRLRHHPFLHGFKATF